MVSETVTVLEAVVALPEASVAVYESEYTPIVLVSTEPVVTIAIAPEAPVRSFLILTS